MSQAGSLYDIQDKGKGPNARLPNAGHRRISHPMKMASPALRLSIFYGAFFWLVGTNLPYWPVWLESRGLGPAEIGLVAAAAFWTRIFIAPTIAMWSDRTGRRRFPLIILAITVTCGYGLLSVTEGYLQILLLYGFIGSLMNAAMPLTDSLTILVQRQTPLDYGRVRLWGSITFILASFAGGWILDATGPDGILYSIIAGAILLCFIAFQLPSVRTAPATRSFAAIGDLIRKPAFVAFVAASATLQSTHAVLYGFATLHWRKAGIEDQVIGMLWAEGVIAEVLLFALAGRYLRRLSPATMLLIAGTAGVIRWTIIGTTTDLTALIAVQILHAFTFGATHLAMIRFMSAAIPDRMSATAQSLYDSLAMGVVFGSLMMGSGILYAHFQGQAFIAMAIASGIGILLTLVFRKLWSGGRVLD